MLKVLVFCIIKHYKRITLSALIFLSLTACSTFTGYATDPATDNSLPASLQDGFGQGMQDEYISAANDPALRRQIRDEIIYRQLNAYDQEFESFERSLASNDNAFSLSSDTAILALGATGAVVGGAATKAALAAASTFIVGTKTAVDKDLFYQATLPALVAQMEARRLQARVPIVIGLGESDSDYPLQQALVDLGTLRSAGSLAAAISSTIQDAGARAAAAQVEIDTAPATAAYLQLSPNRQMVRSMLRSLTPDQALRMAKDMEPTLQQTPLDDTRSKILQSDPNNLRLTDGLAAQEVLERWASADLNDAASIKQWTDELNHVVQQ